MGGFRLLAYRLAIARFELSQRGGSEPSPGSMRWRQSDPASHGRDLFEARIRKAQRSHFLENRSYGLRSLFAQRYVDRITTRIVCIAVDLERELRVDGQ